MRQSGAAMVSLPKNPRKGSPVTEGIDESMPDHPSPEIDLLRATYAAFNSREIDAALALMTADVAWPRAFKGGFVQGPQAVGAYWTEQWGEIDPHVEPMAFHLEGDGRILVEVHQVVRDLTGGLLADERVGHHFTLERGRIRGMEVCPLPSPQSNSPMDEVSNP